jgi:hypothetical protein
MPKQYVMSLPAKRPEASILAVRSDLFEKAVYSQLQLRYVLVEKYAVLRPC